MDDLIKQTPTTPSRPAPSPMRELHVSETGIITFPNGTRHKLSSLKIGGQQVDLSLGLSKEEIVLVTDFFKSVIKDKNVEKKILSPNFKKMSVTRDSSTSQSVIVNDVAGRVFKFNVAFQSAQKPPSLSSVLLEPWHKFKEKIKIARSGGIRNYLRGDQMGKLREIRKRIKTLESKLPENIEQKEKSIEVRKVELRKSLDFSLVEDLPQYKEISDFYKDLSTPEYGIQFVPSYAKMKIDQEFNRRKDELGLTLEQDSKGIPIMTSEISKKFPGMATQIEILKSLHSLANFQGSSEQFSRELFLNQQLFEKSSSRTGAIPMGFRKAIQELSVEEKRLQSEMKNINQERVQDELYTLRQGLRQIIKEANPGFSIYIKKCESFLEQINQTNLSAKSANEINELHMKTQEMINELDKMRELMGKSPNDPEINKLMSSFEDVSRRLIVQISEMRTRQKE